MSAAAKGDGCISFCLISFIYLMSATRSLVVPYLPLLTKATLQPDHSIRELFKALRYGIAWHAMANDFRSGRWAIAAAVLDSGRMLLTVKQHPKLALTHFRCCWRVIRHR